MPKHHPSIGHVLQYFTYEHLPEKLQGISKPFCLLARDLADSLPTNPETTFCLRQLLLAKDAAVRAALPPPVQVEEQAELPLKGFKGQLGQ